MTHAYFIGDIHGELDKLKDVVAKIRKHHNPKWGKGKIITVGDYIDRGPDSFGVVGFLIDQQDDPDFDWIHLRGNHEDMLLFNLQGCFMNGGRETFASYNIHDWSSETAIYNEIGNIHMKWYRSLKLYHVEGKVAVSHAGFDGAFRADEEKEHTLLWDRRIRMHEHDHYKFTVHGHTPMNRALINENCAYIDTGAVFGGPLTALFIPDTDNPDVNTMEIIDSENAQSYQVEL